MRAKRVDAALGVDLHAALLETRRQPRRLDLHVGVLREVDRILAGHRVGFLRQRTQIECVLEPGGVALAAEKAPGFAQRGVLGPKLQRTFEGSERLFSPPKLKKDAPFT